MNASRLSLLAAAALSALATGVVRAEDITPDPYQHMVSTRARAEVVAERDAAIASGELAALHREDSGAMHFARLGPPNTRTRAEVRDEVLAARRAGTLDVLSGEDSGSFALARQHGNGAHADSPRLARVAR